MCIDYTFITLSIYFVDLSVGMSLKTHHPSQSEKSKGEIQHVLKREDTGKRKGNHYDNILCRKSTVNLDIQQLNSCS